jgi:hypothetical protein
LWFQEYPVEGDDQRNRRPDELLPWLWRRAVFGATRAQGRKVDHVHDPDPPLGDVTRNHASGSDRLPGRHGSGAEQHDVGLLVCRT